METKENLLIDNDFEEYIENFEKEVNDNVENYYSCDEGASTYTVLKVGWDARKQFEKNIYRGNIGRLEFEVINQQSKIDSLQAMIEREKDKKCSECKHCKEYESLPFCDSLGTLIQSDFYCKNYEKKGE
jgi:hypothetical protein